MEMNPEGYKRSPEEVLKEVLGLQTEKEAHNVGIQVTDEIWQKVLG